MKPHERQQEILRLLRERQELKVTELTQIFDVSEGTIRNDLDYLGETNQITRVRGGAALANTHQICSPAFAARARLHATNKQRIARWAADMVKDGEAIFLDASSTAFYISSFLHDHRNLTVITSGIETALALAENPSFTVILMGGVVRPGSAATVSPLGEQALAGLHIRSAFLSCGGFTTRAGMTDADIQRAQLKRSVVLSAEQTIGLIESSKFGQVQVSSFAALEQITQILTDRDLDPKHIDELRRTKVVLTICGENTTRSYAPIDEQTRHYKIGFANLDEKRPYAVDVRRGLEEASQQIGHIDLVIGDNQYNSQVALQVADRLLAEKVDLAIEYHFDQNVGAILKDKFSQAGVPVIAVDTPMIGATYFGVDNYRAGWDGGVALGRWIKANWQGRIDKLIVLQHAAGGALPAMRLTGQVEGLQSVVGDIAEPDIIRLDDASVRQETEQAMLGELEMLPAARRLAVLSLSDNTAEAIINAARRSGRYPKAAS
jgi:DeoR/GlpR family transcriptional regulator of sugar metabolism/ABC-type sugar transport system substrate-binding protein